MADHLDGDRPLGISPLREDRTCRWGVVDVDSYDIDHAALWEKVNKESLPVVTCRSKSGGAHLFLFAKDWTPQATMHAALTAVAARLTFPSIDIFPRADGAGNWLNMPYFGGDKTDRYGVKKGGMAMGLEEFVHVAGEAAVGPNQIAQLARPARSKKDATAGPERAQRELKRFAGEIAAQGEGGRNNLLNKHAFAMGRMVGSGWIDADVVEGGRMRAATTASRRSAIPRRERSSSAP